MNQDAYIQLHTRLMVRMRRAVRQKDLPAIQRTGKALCRFRRRYRQKFAA